MGCNSSNLRMAAVSSGTPGTTTSSSSNKNWKAVSFSTDKEMGRSSSWRKPSGATTKQREENKHMHNHHFNHISAMTMDSIDSDPAYCDRSNPFSSSSINMGFGEGSDNNPPLPVLHEQRDPQQSIQIVNLHEKCNHEESSSHTAGSGHRQSAVRRSSKLTFVSEAVAAHAVDTTEKQDKNNGHTITILENRESHTADLEAFDRYIERLKELERHDLDSPFHEGFWTFLRDKLEEHGQPIGYGPHPDGPDSAVVAKGPDDNMAFIVKKFALDPFSPVNPTAVAEMAGIDLGIVLTELSYATQIGLASVKFSPECTRCGGAVCEEENLNTIATRVNGFGVKNNTLNCAGCRQPNCIRSLDDIAVVYFLDPQVLYVLADGFGCKPSSKAIANCAMPIACVPGTSTGSGFRYSIGCGGDLSLGDPLPKGRYRMHCPIARTDNYLEVLGDPPTEEEKEDSAYTLSLNVSDMQFCSQSQGGGSSSDERRMKTITVPHGAIHFDIKPDTNSLFALWVQHDTPDEDTVFGLPGVERVPLCSASLALNHPAFNRLLCDSAAIFVARPNLEIRNVVLVFTDVVGSTDMYAKLGDSKALELIDKHFEVIFAAFGKHGRIVKTVGDAVMASFPSGRAAIQAVAAALANVGEACSLPDGSELQIRVGINKGPALVIPLNGIVDYFGQTVNIAARVEGKAQASSCLVTDSVLSDPDAAAAYEEVLGDIYAEFESIKEEDLDLKGVSHRVRTKGFRHLPCDPESANPAAA